ncbi:MAG: SecY family transport protein, partial [Bacillota bacterium]|nr:SecY family transport protein [Bacillota bacterium]
EKGIGNGISLFIFAGIVASIPGAVIETTLKLKEGAVNILAVLAFVVVSLVVIMGIVFIQQGTRKIPVQHAKKVVGRKVYGGNATHIPLKVNQAGVIPIIFAISLLMVPMIFAQFFPESGYAMFMRSHFGATSFAYNLLYVLLIIGFTYFYTSVTFNPVEIADRLKTSGGFVPGIRPGKPTSDFLTKTVNRISFAGAIFLAVVAIIPNILGIVFPQMSFGFGGTSLLILVSVALETMKQIEAQMMMRHYEGFLD